MKMWNCTKSDNLSALDSTSKSLMLLKYHSNPRIARDLMNAIHTCYTVAFSRWANFIVVDYREVKIAFDDRISWVCIKVNLSCE